MRNTAYGKLVAALIAAWFLLALAASAFHVFTNNSARLGLPVAFAALTPILLFLLWLATSPGFCQFALSRSPRILTLAQAWRIGGFVFLALYVRGALPGIFALPAGWGDVAIGATALFAAWKLATPARRAAFILWQVLGLLDLVMAVSLGTTARLLSPHGASMLPMTVLPLSLVPTFIVPLLLIFHLICISQARRWGASQPSQLREQLASSNPSV